MEISLENLYVDIEAKTKLDQTICEEVLIKYFWCVINRASELGSLSSDVFERRTSTGSKPFSLLVSLDATIFVLPSVLIPKETICPKICSKSRLKCAKSPFPVDVHRSKTTLLKLPNEIWLFLPWPIRSPLSITVMDKVYWCVGSVWEGVQFQIQTQINWLILL